MSNSANTDILDGVQVGNRFFAIDVDNFPDRNVLAKLLPSEPP